MKKFLPFFILFALLSFNICADEKPPVPKWTVKTAFEQKVFIENKGQYDLKKKASSEEILFGARIDGLQYFFTKTGLWIKYAEKVERTKRELEKSKNKLERKKMKMQTVKRKKTTLQNTNGLSVFIKWNLVGPEHQQK